VKLSFISRAYIRVKQETEKKH